MKPVYDVYVKKNFKFTKEKYDTEHKTEIDEYKKAVRFLKANHETVVVKSGEYDLEIKNRQAQDVDSNEALESIKTEMWDLKQIRFFVNEVLEKETPAQQSEVSSEMKNNNSIHDRLNDVKKQTDEQNQQRNKDLEKPKKKRNNDLCM